jgi:hypothetical protein
MTFAYFRHPPGEYVYGCLPPFSGTVVKATSIVAFFLCPSRRCIEQTIRKNPLNAFSA